MKQSTCTFHVATNGDDRWSGRLAAPNAEGTDGPLATLAAARDAIRRLKHGLGGALDRPVAVLVRGGTYPMAAPLQLSGGDSGTALCPITYAAYPGEKPILSGGRTIAGWKPFKDGIYCAHLPDVRAGLWWFRQLFCDGRRMIRARYPKHDGDDPRYGGWAFVEETVPESDELEQSEKREIDPDWKFRIDPDRVGTGQNWFAPGFDDSAWETLSVGRTWNAQGHKDYHGSAWYRTRVTVPEGFDRREHFWLLFGGADKEAIVYIDGRKAFEHTAAATGKGVNELWQEPFMFDARPHLTPGREHVLAVRVDSEAFNGGLWRPVYLASTQTLISPSLLVGIVRRPVAFRYERGTFPHRWSRPRQAEVFIVPGRSWISDIIPIQKVDHDRRTIHLMRLIGPSRHTLGMATHIEAGNRYYVENNLEDLTEPGEWCLDAEEGMVYFRPPGGDIDAVHVTAPATGRLIQMIGHRGAAVAHVNVRGFTLTQTRVDWPTPESYYKTPNAGQTVYMENTQDCAIADNDLLAVGGDAIRLQNRNARARITGNHIAEAGAYGIFVGALQRGFSRHDSASGDVPSPTEWHRDPSDREAVVNAWPVSREHLISNNHIHDVGVFEKHANGIAFYGVSAVDVVVSHNLIHHTPRFGIGMMSGFGRITIEYNELHDLSLETCDTGAITANRWYTYDKDPELALGNIIRFNIIRDVVGCGSYGHKMEPGGGSAAGGRIWVPYYSWGIYFDNAPMDVLVYGNIVSGNTLGGIMISHYCQNVTIENNIFIDSDNTQAYLLLAGTMCNIRFRRNIFSYTNPEADLMRLNMGPQVDVAAVISEFNGNLYHHATGKAQTFSGLPGEAAERVGMDTGGEPTLEQWRAMGFDRDSIVADPLFVDRERGDYGLQADSPALKLGFEPIDVSRIGLLRSSG